jgi:hypothetical protein
VIVEFILEVEMSKNRELSGFRVGDLVKAAPLIGVDQLPYLFDEKQHAIPSIVIDIKDERPYFVSSMITILCAGKFYKLKSHTLRKINF